MNNLSKLKVPGKRFLTAACLLFVLGATTNAYTVVMRDGRRVEIPAQFTVTKTTLTYEASPGVLITLQMGAIDISATERANNESTGSLLGRATQQKESPRTTESTRVAGRPKASRSVTNRELEAFARARAESDRAYEQQRRELGLPPLEVSRAQAAAEAERFWLELERKRAEEEAETRASELQAQISALNYQLNYLQGTLGERSAFTSGAFSGFGGFPSVRPFGRTIIRPPLFGPRFGLPIGAEFQTFGVPFGSRPRFHGVSRNVFAAPGTRVRVRVGFGHGPHMRGRFR